ncbi:hypothetical protein ACFFQF_25075 [Haladaptatus pallidirubidus]|uniref:Secreted protein n=1 Tax=Haladaptatus pallidirubidus TaxID=1008152 RepID=A0AAV3UKX5_9EURY|nr:hypothetical protein [Haladaptatus pallidirubidus]
MNWFVGAGLLVVLVFAVVLGTAVGTTAESPPTTEPSIAVTDRTNVGGGNANRAIGTSAVDTPSESVDSCVPETGNSLRWHLERYGTGCSSERSSRRPV